ncbi:MAG TPA: aminotransferase class I/II-fold pyridoxal phosphate-dependent enzyme, partial [Anseongella sp.]|nr:aminotransferase class I/II-fold pyridoxal phosphate-dependent enzyme [Anseongella sp.]
MPEIARRLQHTEEYYFSRKLREIEQMNREGEKVINLGIGSPDLPPHPDVIEELCSYAGRRDTHAYQNYKGIPALRQAISSWYKRYYGVELDPESEILPLIGSKEGIMHICMTYLQEGDQALIPNPGYPTYRSAVELSGASCVEYELTEAGGWLPDLESLAGNDLSRVKLMWVNYPHMPTGTRAGKDFFERLVAFATERNILLCHDNPYSFILNDKPESLLSVAGAREVALELNSLSKSANMAGWRTGMLAGKAAFISDVL